MLSFEKIKLSRDEFVFEYPKKVDESMEFFINNQYIILNEKCYYEQLENIIYCNCEKNCKFYQINLYDYLKHCIQEFLNITPLNKKRKMETTTSDYYIFFTQLKKSIIRCQNSFDSKTKNLLYLLLTNSINFTKIQNIKQDIQKIYFKH